MSTSQRTHVLLFYINTLMMMLMEIIALYFEHHRLTRYLEKLYVFFFLTSNQMSHAVNTELANVKVVSENYLRLSGLKGD